MKTAPVTPAEIAFSDDGVPREDAFRIDADTAEAALSQARRVFLEGNGLPLRWQGRERFVVLQTRFGWGHDFLATWQAWREDPRRCERLFFIALDEHPPTQRDLSRAQAGSALPALASQLIAAWPPPTPNLHPIDFEHGRVHLLLGLGPVARLLPQIMAAVDAFFIGGAVLDGERATPRPEVLKQIGRLAAPGATASAPGTGAAWRAGLLTAGFDLDATANAAAGASVTTARHAPRHRPAALPGALHRHEGAREAVVIGAGLAGCAAAWALSREGWRVTLLDREAAPAQATSGNAVGLFHGAVHPADGPHARLHRAAALRAARVLAPWIASSRVRGQIDGLLRLTDGLPDARAAAFATGHAEALGIEMAQARAGVPVPEAGWWFREGGWLVPGDFARALLEDSGARFIGGGDVTRIERIDERWQVFDTAGTTLAEAPVLVLANALQIPSLLGAEMADALGTLTAARGQISGVPVWGPNGSNGPNGPNRPVGAGGRCPTPRVPVSGSGYAVPEVDGLLWCGATTQIDDHDPLVREADHRRNLDQLARLIGQPAMGDHALSNLQGRVGWRAVTPDRLPWVGALPDLAAFEGSARADRVRFVPRLRNAQGGLHVLGALGSRGITWAVLCGELLASWVSGSPCPVEADLRDALDPARRRVAQRRHDLQDQPRDRADS